MRLRMLKKMTTTTRIEKHHSYAYTSLSFPHPPVRFISCPDFWPCGYATCVHSCRFLFTFIFGSLFNFFFLSGSHVMHYSKTDKNLLKGPQNGCYNLYPVSCRQSGCFFFSVFTYLSPPVFCTCVHVE